MAQPSEAIVQLQAALADLCAPAGPAASFLYPGPQRYALIRFLLSKLLSASVLHELQERYAGEELPAGLSAEEVEAHRLARVLQAVDMAALPDAVRGCGSESESLHLLCALASLAVAHQQHTRDPAACAAAAMAAPPLAFAAGTAAAASPGPSSTSATGSIGYQRSPTPRLTPSRQGQQGSTGSGGYCHQQLEPEMRLLEGLAERLPGLLDPGGGGNWFPADMMAALQPYMPSSSLPLPGVAVVVEQRGSRLRADLPALRAEEARLAGEVVLASEADWQRAADATRDSLERFLATSAAFAATFQTGLGVWCAASRPADTCGLGPMANDVLSRYDTVRRLAGDLAAVRQAHGAIVSCAPPLSLLEPHSLSQLAGSGQAAVERVRERLGRARAALAGA